VNSDRHMSVAGGRRPRLDTGLRPLAFKGRVENGAAARRKDRKHQYIHRMGELMRRRQIPTCCVSSAIGKRGRAGVLGVSSRLYEFHGYLTSNATHDTNAPARTTDGLQFELVGQTKHALHEEQCAGFREVFDDASKLFAARQQNKCTDVTWPSLRPLAVLRARCVAFHLNHSAGSVFEEGRTTCFGKKQSCLPLTPPLTEDAAFERTLGCYA
jgi:hypothetical protein